MLTTRIKSGTSMPKPTKNGRHHFKWMLYQGQKIRIDRDIVPLLTSMWELGIGTTNSCQGVCSRNCHKVTHTKLKDGTIYSDYKRTADCKSRIWIAFDSAKSLERFTNLVAVYEKDNRDSMYELINGWSSHDEWKRGKFRCIPNPDNWEHIHHMPNLGVRFHVERFPNNIPSEPKYYHAYVDDDCPRNNFRMEPQIKFPRKHLSYVMERLNLALQRKGK